MNVYVREAFLYGVSAGMTISEIAEMLGMSVGGVHYGLRKLEGEGLIEPPRKPGAARDRKLTERGRVCLQESRSQKVELVDRRPHKGRPAVGAADDQGAEGEAEGGGHLEE